MRVREVLYEDYVNYKHPVMLIGCCFCDWKCCKENANCKCHNEALADHKEVLIQDETLIERYMNNPLVKAIVFAGLEPILQISEIVEFISRFRECSHDEVIIYTGYYPGEIQKELDQLRVFDNIIMKFGRYIPNKKSKFDKVLGIDLPSDNQFAAKIS